MKSTTCFALAALSSALVFLGSLKADDWPAFRGPNGNGVSGEVELPVQWTKDNFLWKVKLPGPGTSSPITYGEKVFVTCYTGYGTTLSKGGGFGFDFEKGGKGGFGKGGFGKGGAADAEQKKLKFVVLCIDRQKGTVTWQKEVAPKLPEATLGMQIKEHGYTTSTPATDGERVYVFFGKTGVLAFDMAGKQLWQTSVGTSTNINGTGSSPLLYKDLVIVNAAIESQSLVALDKKTGKEVWRARGMGTSWSSPLLVETKDGKQEVVLNLPGSVKAYDPDTGKELWRCQGIGNAPTAGGGFGGMAPASASTTPVAQNGVVYVIGGGGPGGPATTLAIKAGGRGDVTKTHVLWKAKAGAQFCSPVVSGDYLYWVDGMIYCLRTDTGKIVYRERVYSSRGEYDSAVVAGNKIYALTRFDGLYVLATGEKYKRLAHNEFSGDQGIFNASPALSEGRIFVRSTDYLYCIGKKE